MSLSKDYRSKILKSVKEKLGMKNINEVPRIEKVVINIGIGSYISRKDKDYSSLVDRITVIAGQKPVVIKAKKSVSNFKLRKGVPNGISVTLRGKRQLDFLERLINIALPRTRDFRGLSKKAFDGKGNYSMGIKEVTIFPSVRVDDLTKMHGLQVNISTTAKTDKEAKVLLEEIGIPFVK